MTRRAFTLVELLIVIAIIGILVSLLLPAVQAAREAARRIQCSNNLKQLGLAVLNYESAHRILPPASIWNVADGADPRYDNQTKFSANWVILTLPFLEQQTLFDAFDHKQYIGAPANAKARGTVLATMRCPTDNFTEQPFNGSKTPRTSNVGDGWARGTYGASAAIGQQVTKNGRFDYSRHGIVHGSAFANSDGWKSDYLRGVMGANTSVTLAQIRDGTSKTMLIAEIRAGIDEVDPRGCWAMSGCASSLWAHGTYWSDVTGPNTFSGDSDNVSTCRELSQKVGLPNMLQLGMGCFDVGGLADFFNQTTVKSMHVGGVQACFADGSVHFISDFVESKGNWSANPPQLPVWDKLIASSDGQSISGESY